MNKSHFLLEGKMNMLNSLLEIKFEINLFSIVAFLAGVLAGFLLLGLIYVISCLHSLRKKRINLNKELEKISEEDIKTIIHKYQDAFSDEKKRRKSIPFDYFRMTLFDMMNEIAGKFYPKSKRPLTELSLNELILLDEYIVKKIDELLSKKGLNLFRSLKLSTIMMLVDKKTALDNAKVVKAAKRYKLKEIYDVFLTMLNFINPYFWFKKIVVNPSINLLINKIFLICYSIVGEETYNIYSKQAFVTEDTKLKELLSSIDENQQKLKKEGLLVENKVSEEIVDLKNKKN